MGYKILDFGELRFGKDYLASLPDHHLDFLVSSSLAANDTAILRRLLSGYMPSPTGSAEIQEIRLITCMTIIRTYSSKLFEFLKFLTTYAKTLRKRGDSQEKNLADRIQSTAREAMSASAYRIVSDLRHNATHHYKIGPIRRLIDNLPDDHVFELLISDKTINSFYGVGEDIAHSGRLLSKDGGYHLQEVLDWIADTGVALADLHHEVIAFIFEQYRPPVGERKRVIIDNELVIGMDGRLPVLSFEDWWYDPHDERSKALEERAEARNPGRGRLRPPLRD